MAHPDIVNPGWRAAKIFVQAALVGLVIAILGAFMGLIAAEFAIKANLRYPLFGYVLLSMPAFCTILGGVCGFVFGPHRFRPDR
ncbi:MAG: hypothetical protein WAK91_03800 [Candidatus Acidiferrales bacterium]|jgi:hypothetical protein